MTMSLIAAGAGLTLLGTAGQKNVERARHADKVSSAQIGLERMTRELRQADWLVFRSSMVVDAQVPVRVDGAAAAQPRLVRFDCSQGTTCVRREGAPTSYPPPAAPTFTEERVAISSVRPGTAIFVPQVVDPATGEVRTTYTNPTTLAVALEVTVEGWDRPIRLDDSVTLRNATTFAEPA